MTMERFGYSETDYQKYKKYAWTTLLTFSVMYLFVYNGRLNMGLALPQMIKDLGWTKAQAGIIVSVVFWAYAFGQLINGRLSEILGVKRFIFIGAILSVVANIVLSFQENLFVIAIIWGINGYLQAMIFAPGISLAARWFPSRRRGMAVGVVSSSAAASQIIVWICVFGAFSLATQWGWRAAFRLPVLITAVFAIVFWFLAKGSPGEVGLKEYEEDPDIKVLEESYAKVIREKGKLYPYFVLFKNWTFPVWCFIIILGSFARYSMLTWITVYFVEVLKVNIKTGVMFTIVFPLGMMLGTFMWPYLSDKVFNKNRAIGIVIGTLGGAVIAFLLPRLGTVTGAQIGVFLLGVFPLGIGALIWAYATDVGTRAFAGTAVGVLDWLAYIGAALQAIVLGGVLQKTGGNWYVVFNILAGIFLLMMLLAIVAYFGSKSKAQAKALVS
jgi:sugar phosphate permease